LKNFLSTGVADVAFGWGATQATARPVGGDWNGDGAFTVGLYTQTNSTFLLADSNGFRHSDTAAPYGPLGANWLPVVGQWNGPAAAVTAAAEPRVAPIGPTLAQSDLELIAAAIVARNSPAE
jgi:hypothetical protein